MSPARQQAPLPFTILTGFLGSGKTTLLNRVLSAQHHRRVAVLVNELGRIDIDAGLIRSRSGDVMELSGGCVCHQIGVQRELWSALEDICRRSRPDAVVLETSGIAEPGAILKGLAEWQDSLANNTDDANDDEENLWRRLAVSAVVTVVDAEAGEAQLEKYAEARDQVICADRILLSKTDLASASALGRIHARLASLNAHAERAAFPAGTEGTTALIPWLFQGTRRAPTGTTGSTDHAGAHASGHAAHAHSHQLAAATYVDDVPLVAEALTLTCRELGDRLVRAKGWVNLAGEDRRGFLERAGLHTDLRLAEPWGDEPRTTRLVLIGEDLDDAEIRRRLWACRAGVSKT